MNKKVYKVSYGVMSHREHSTKVYCDENIIDDVAVAIYKGEIGNGLGVLVVSDGEGERVLIDRM